VGIRLPRTKFSTPFSQCFQDSASHPPFQEQPIEEKFELEKSIETLLESQQQMQNMIDSQFS